MKIRPALARVLVASDNGDDAVQITQHLGGQFDSVRASTDPARAVADFEDFRPDVLVLAFDSLAKAQSYALGLYRQSAIVGSHRHATVLLCAKDDVRAAFELCKGGNFDDYVLYWPHAQDGHRLAMSVWAAARAVAALAASPTRHEIDNHAQKVVAVDTLLRKELSEGAARFSGAARGIEAAERGVGAAIDALTQRLSGPAGDAIVAGRDKAALARELARLKSDGVSTVFKASAASVEPLAAWPKQLQERLEPHLADLRGFASTVAGGRTLLVVDDDAFVRKLIATALDDQGFDLEFAQDGASAMRMLQRVRPRLILMDVQLPDMDGITLTKKLKAAPRLAAIPVLMLTGDARRETLASSISAGAAGFIVKPFTREALLQHVARALPAAA